MDLSEPTPQPIVTTRPGWLLITGTALLVLVCMGVWYRNTMLATGDFSAAMGGAAAPPFWAVAVVLLFSISRRFRSKRSQTQVALWALVVFALVGISRMSESWNRAFVRGLNANCPKMIDAATRMDGATTGPGQLITIRNTAVAVDGASIDRVAWQTTIAPALRANALKAPGVRKMLTWGMTVSYRYTGRDGVLIDEVTLTPDDLKK
jgi:hypothetical protein